MQGASETASGPHYGTVKSYNAGKGWGFIECEETQRLYGQDGDPMHIQPTMVIINLFQESQVKN